MSKADELLALAERCEKASEGSRELDARIACVLDNRSIHVIVDGDVLGRNNRPPHDICIVGWAPSYTTSLDAAMTLVPERYSIEDLSWWPFVAKGYEDQRKCRITILAVDHEGFGTRDRYNSVAATPALALCAAALRAAAEMES